MLDGAMGRAVARKEGRGRLPDGFAVPASALGVGRREHFLIGFGGPFKRGRKLGFFNLIVVADEDFG